MPRAGGVSTWRASSLFRSGLKTAKDGRCRRSPAALRRAGRRGPAGLRARRPGPAGVTSFAATSTACPWRSSSPPRGWTPCHPQRSMATWPTGFASGRSASDRSSHHSLQASRTGAGAPLVPTTGGIRPLSVFDGPFTVGAAAASSSAVGDRRRRRPTPPGRGLAAPRLPGEASCYQTARDHALVPRADLGGSGSVADATRSPRPVLPGSCRDLCGALLGSGRTEAWRRWSRSRRVRAAFGRFTEVGPRSPSTWGGPRARLVVLRQDTGHAASNWSSMRPRGRPITSGHPHGRAFLPMYATGTTRRSLVDRGRQDLRPIGDEQGLALCSRAGAISPSRPVTYPPPSGCCRRVSMVRDASVTKRERHGR